MDDLDYKAHANLLKDQGNALFESGDIQAAIKLYTQGIDIDPDNHIIYSNRCAAYMKADSISKALKDAEKCIELAPNWAKGYSRLGAAQQGLRRFEAAIETFKRGIEKEPNNQGLWSSLRAAEEAYATDKKIRFAEAAKEREEEEARRVLRHASKNSTAKPESTPHPTKAKEEEDLLSNFLAEVTNPPTHVASGETFQAQATPSTNAANLSTESEPPKSEDDLLAGFFSEIVTEKKAVDDAKPVKDEKILTEKYTKQDLGDSKAQLRRIMAPHYEWKNCNPFAVLQLDIDATEEDINYRYRKLSVKVHPDKLRDEPLARECFEQVKIAYQKLCDEKTKATTIMNIEFVREETAKERKRLLSKGMKESDLWDLTEEINRRLLKHFAEIEMQRRTSEENVRAYNARERMQEDHEKEKNVKFMEFEKEWSEIDRREKRVGGWRDFQDVPEAKRKVASSYKEEIREESKHGIVKVETWKKKWK